MESRCLPIVVGLDLGSAAEMVYSLEILHMSDQEGNGSSVVHAPNASAVLNALEAQDLGGDGDAIIPSAFYDVSAAIFGHGGVADIQILNEIGFQAARWAITNLTRARRNWPA